MTNPVFSRDPHFADPRSAVATRSAQQPAVEAATLEQMYSSPSATPLQTGRLTYDDVIVKTAGLLVLLVATGAVAWVLAPTMPWLLWVGLGVGLVLGLVNAFRREPSPALIAAYAGFEGLFLGGISRFFEAMWPGIAVQAVLATVATFAATLVLFRSGKVRVTPKFTRWVIIALAGYLVFSLVNLVLWFFNPADGFGPLRAGPLGIAIGLFAVGLAAASLLIDFDAIKRGVENGVPRKFAWTAAFGLVVTLVWLYIEFLRLLAILRGE